MKNESKEENQVEEKECVAQSRFSKNLVLFTSPTCPNCKMAKQILAKANVEYEEIDAYSNPELSKEFNILKAPTLLVFENGNYQRFDNASLIKAYVESKK